MKKIENQDIEKILEELEESLKIRRYSDATKKRYNTVLRAYLYYEEENGKDLRNLTEEDVIQYLKMLTEERNYKPSSYNNVNAILKYFLEIVLGRNIAYRKLPNAKIGYRRKNVVRKEDLLDAKVHPENHRSLTIRVAGYTAYFVELAGKLQDEIIERTTYDHI